MSLRLGHRPAAGVRDGRGERPGLSAGLGRLDAAFWASLYETFEQRVADGADPAELAARIDAGLIDDVVEDSAGGVYEELRESLPSLVKGLIADEKRLGRNMTRVWGPADNMFRASIYLGYELGAAIASSSDRHGPKVFALLGAHGRALRTASEVRHLAMGGFATGATARWRTLHELTVLSAVLRKSDDEIAQRYLAFARIENLKDVRAYQGHADALGLSPYSDESYSATEQAAKQVTDQWPDIDQANGWAAPLFPDKRRVTFFDLEVLAELAHLRPFYLLGNNYIHAGAKASELNMSPNSGTQGRTITTGPTVHGDIAETCHGAMISLHQATAALVVAHLEARGSAAIDLLVGLKAQGIFVEDARDQWGIAAESARTRGWFTHRPEDD